MRTNTLDEIKKDYADWLVYEAIFETPEVCEECDLSLELEKDGIQIWIDYEFGTIFIAGLTAEEQKYLKEVR